MGVKNRRNGGLAHPDRAPAPLEKAWITAGKVLHWPLTEGMVSPPAYGLVALVLADAAFVKDRKLSSPAWIHGTRWATEPGFLGDRDLSTAPALAAAAHHPDPTAAIHDPAQSFQL